MAWLIPLIPMLAAPALAYATAGRPAGEEALRRRLGWLATGAMVLTAVAAGMGAAGGWAGDLAWTGDLGLSLEFARSGGPFVGIFAVLVPAVAAPVLLYAAWHEEARGLIRLLTVLTFFVGAMELVAGAADLLTLLVGWELIGACSAILVSHEWRKAGNPRAGTVVFLTTRAGDLGLFLALAAAFAGVGSLDYDALHGLSGIHLQLVVLGVLVAAAAKSAQLPFAPWLFAAMEGPVTVSTLLHSSTMVAAGAFLLIRLHPVLDAVAWFAPAAMGIGLATALAGGVVALLQSHAKRLLAGSTSAHYGLMFVAVGAGYPAVAALHLVAHAVSKAPLFLATGIAGRFVDSYQLHRMRLRPVLPAVAAASAAAAAAIAGLPPLGAAWTKEEVVTAAGHHAPWLAVLVALAGGLSAAYMGRWFFQAFGDGNERRGGRRPRSAERAGLYLLAGAAAVAGVLWIPLLHDAAGRLLGGDLPAGKIWELAVSLALVGLGVGLGRAIAVRRPTLGVAGPAEAVGDWLGLPALARLTVIRPARGLATFLAAVDDRALDGVVRGVAAAGRTLAGAAAVFDDRIVDGAVRLVAALGRGAAVAGRRLVEAALDLIPEGTSRAVGRAGSATRRLQTGLAHHYYRLIVVGFAALLVLLILGG